MPELSDVQIFPAHHVKPTVHCNVAVPIDEKLASVGRPRVVEDAAGRLFQKLDETNDTFLNGVDAHRPNLVAITRIAATKHIHARFLAQVVRERHLANVSTIDEVERDEKSIW